MERTALAPRLRDRLAPYRPLLRPVCVMSGLYILGISAILRANFYYVDDIMRAYDGSMGWDAFSRYLSNFVSFFLHADSFLTDISPLPQLLACVLLGAASVTVLYVITGRMRFSVWEYAAVLPLGLSPYMLECLSFKYDAPYMAISILASVAPLLAAGKDPPVTLSA